MGKLTWQKIDGWPYEVSNGGEVRRVGSRQPLTPQVTDRGYLRVQLHDDGRVKTFKVHRLVAQVFVAGSGPTVNHEDGDKKNNRSDNLKWATRSEQALHRCRVLKTARPQGETCGRAKLREVDVRAIRVARAEGEALAVIADRFGVTEANISAIVRRKTWAHVA